MHEATNCCLRVHMTVSAHLSEQKKAAAPAPSAPAQASHQAQEDTQQPRLAAVGNRIKDLLGIQPQSVQAASVVDTQARADAIVGKQVKEQHQQQQQQQQQQPQQSQLVPFRETQQASFRQAATGARMFLPPVAIAADSASSSHLGAMDCGSR